MRSLARRLIASDTSQSKSFRRNYSDAFEVCEKLRPPLSTLVGNEAFRALLAHALALAEAEVPGLRSVRVKSDGKLEMSEEIPARFKTDQHFEGKVVLVAQLLGLLVAFIGEKITLRLVREGWPNVAFNDLEMDDEDKNENKIERH
jgi:hypothetical protein